MSFHFISSLFFILSAWNGALCSLELIYPVGSFCNSFNSLLIYGMYQYSLQEITFFLYDQDKESFSLPIPRYHVVAGIDMLSCTNKIIFIDRGRIKIYDPDSSSTMLLTLDFPLSLINMVYWIDENSCYFCAKRQGLFGIFQADIPSGAVHSVLWGGQVDYLYPQKIGSNLFAIRRASIKNNYRYQVIKTAFEIQPFCMKDQVDNLFGKSGDVCITNELHGAETTIAQHEEVVVYNGSRLTFSLKMIDDSRGYFLSYCSDEMNINSENIFFSCHLFQWSDLHWEEKKIFTFAVPLRFLFGKDKLYESIIPFIPRYYQESLYYASCHATEGLSLYVYDMQKEKESTIYCDKMHKGDCFAPHVCDKMIFYGTMGNGMKNIINFKKK